MLFNSIDFAIFLPIVFLLYWFVFQNYFRVYKTDLFSESSIGRWLHKQTALYFCTLFQFMLGAFALKYSWHEWVSSWAGRWRYKNFLAVVGIVLLIVGHGIVPNFIVAPFTALGFIFLFLQMDVGRIGNKLLDFLAPHATNLWLTHMFFYMIYFKDFVYSFRYVPLIFLALVVMCLISSYVVNYIYRKIQKTR